MTSEAYINEQTHFGFKNRISYIYFYIILNGKSDALTKIVDIPTVGLCLHCLRLKPALVITKVGYVLHFFHDLQYTVF